MATNRTKLKKAMRKELLRQQRRQSVAADRQGASPSRPNLSALSPWHAALAGNRALMERMDGFAPLRNKLSEVAAMKGEWAGLPMPLEDEALVVEPTYPFAAGLMAMCAGAEKADPEEEGLRLRNTFWSVRKQSRILIIEEPSGRVTFGLDPGIHHLPLDLRTLGCADAWGIDQERAALQLLGTLLPHRNFKQYLMTGMFLERSKRSGVTYLFRRLKPTVAIVPSKKGGTRILCTLCLHPIAYYSGSWAGAMCPTDDVVAHLMLMRGDEPMLWRRANQHPAWAPEAGL